jgi:hypothetical protein
MGKRAWDVDDIIQISPTWDARFGGACLVVTEVRAWGVIGYVAVPGAPASQTAFFRLPYESDKEGCTLTGVRVGLARWLFHAGGVALVDASPTEEDHG